LITPDTSAILALLNRRDPDHSRTTSALQAERPPFLVPVAIQAEVTYFIEDRFGTRVLDAYLLDLEAGTFALDCGLDDLPVVRHLVQRYADLPLGFADAAVIACGERNGGRIMTLDRRDFDIVARERRIEPLPSQ
jgi:predicted nucleic acid-binding protein